MESYAQSAGLRSLLPGYLEYLAMRQRSATFVDASERDLGYFCAWCEDRGIVRADEVTRPIVEKYQRTLFLYRKKNGKPLGASTQYGRLCAVKMFFKWAARQRHVMNNPASELEMPKLPMRLPRDVLTPTEAEQVLSQPDVKDPLGIRDRALLEVFYSTGLRRTELVRLLVHDISHERGTLMVREGKGKRDRVVPVGDRALQWIQKYLDEVRPRLVMEPDGQTLFLSNTGEAFHPDYMSRMTRLYVEKAQIGKRGSCHLFRHTMATAMLENGADIRFIQVMLGHAKLETTAIYTRVSVAKLKEIHTATHPSSRPRARATDEKRETGAAAAELLTTLDAEDEESLSP